MSITNAHKYSEKDHNYCAETHSNSLLLAPRLRPYIRRGSRWELSCAYIARADAAALLLRYVHPPHQAVLRTATNGEGVAWLKLGGLFGRHAGYEIRNLWDSALPQCATSKAHKSAGVNLKHI
eukprot:scaffold106578_cov34-Prasinocladus_malaysianus.AAC.1